MKKIFSAIAVLAALLVADCCQKPADIKPSVAKNGINSFVASFPDDDREENAFYGEIDYENHTIVVVVPYTYPANSEFHNTKAKLTRMRVEAGLDDNVIIDPPLLYMDLTEPNYFNLTDQLGKTVQYTVTGEIRKSADCSFTDFTIPELGLVSIIDVENNKIAVLTQDAVGSALAKYALAFGATVSPDPATTALNYDQNVKLTVTAQDGTTQKIYSVVKEVPTKRQIAMREGSGAVLWQKKLPDLGITTQNMTNSIAALSDYLVVNTRGENLLVLNRKTGEKVKTIVPPMKGGTDNFCITSDDADNILLCNLTPNSGNVLKVYRAHGVDGTFEPYITYDGGGIAMGRRISVYGNLDSRAVITAPIYVENPNRFLRWDVVDGVLNTTPEIVSVADPQITSWGTNSDVILRGFTANSDYLVSCYAEPRCHLWIDGTNNCFRSVSEYPGNPNWVPNAVDYVTFNNNPYAVFNSINSFTWGSDDIIYLYDASANNLADIIWKCDHGTYGSMAVSGTPNANYGGDVALRVSDDGFFMYLYFMFCDGYVVCVQFDCIQK